MQQAATLAGHPKFELVLNMLSVRQGTFYYFLGDFEAANKYLQAGLQTTSPQSEMAFAFNMLGKVARLQDKKSIAEAQLGQGLAISREIGDLNRMAEALHGLAEVAGTFGEYTTGQQLGSESLAISRQLGRPDRVAQALSVLAWNTSCLGAYSESKAYYEESLAICQKIGDRDGIAIALNHLGWVAWCIADLTEATAYCEKALAINREIGHRWNVAMCLGDLALMTNELGEYEKATQYSQEGLAITQEFGNLDLMSYYLYCLGAAACGLGDFQASRNYLAESLQTAWRVQIPSHVTVALFHFAMLLVKESDLADFPESVKLQQKAKALELLTLVIDQPATWQAIKDRASHLQAELESTLPAVIVTRARAQGESQTLEAVVAEILREARPADRSKAAKEP